MTDPNDLKKAFGEDFLDKMTKVEQTEQTNALNERIAEAKAELEKLRSDQIEEMGCEARDKMEKYYTPTHNQYGWLCPRCGRGNAPYTSTCLCLPPEPLKVTF